MKLKWWPAICILCYCTIKSRQPLKSALVGKVLQGTWVFSVCVLINAAILKHNYEWDLHILSLLININWIDYYKNYNFLTLKWSNHEHNNRHLRKAWNLNYLHWLIIFLGISNGLFFPFFISKCIFFHTLCVRPFQSRSTPSLSLFSKQISIKEVMIRWDKTVSATKKWNSQTD